MSEVIIPFIDLVAEESKPAVTSFVTNSGATTEDIAGFKTFDEFLSGYKPKVSEPAGDWTTSLEAEQKALRDIKGWKTPGDAIKSYAEVEKLVGHDKIAMPKKDKDGNYEPGELDRVMTQLGRPKDPKEYKPSANFKLPEGIQINEKALGEFNANLHKAGMLPHQYAAVMDEIGKFLNQGMQATKEANEKTFNESVLNLRNKWGAAYDEKAKIANTVLKNFADPKTLVEVVKKYGNDPAIIELLANVGVNLSEEVLARANMLGALLTPENAKLEIVKIREERSKELMDNTHPQHNYWVSKLEELYKMTAR